ncbi:MAG: hypothetical protein V4539_01795 [Bacteroidota bacterium]
MKKLLVKYSLILLVGIFIEWWIVWSSPLNLPQFIPGTPIDIGGLLLTGLLLVTLIPALKEANKISSKTISQLTIFGALICFSAEIIFQPIRIFWLETHPLSDEFQFLLIGTIGVSLFASVFSFFIAFQLKTRKTKALIGLIVAFIIIVNIFKYWLWFMNKP